MIQTIKKTFTEAFMPWRTPSCKAANEEQCAGRRTGTPEDYQDFLKLYQNHLVRYIDNGIIEEQETVQAICNCCRETPLAKDFDSIKLEVTKKLGLIVL